MNRHRIIPLLATLAVSATAGTAFAASLPSPDDPAFQVPQGKVEHTVATVKVEGSRAAERAERIERWMSDSHARTVVKDLKTGKVRREITYTPGESRIFDASKNTVTVIRESKTKTPPWNTAAFEAATQRAYAEQGITRVTGEKTVAGRRVLIVESVPGKWRSDEPESRTEAVVDAETYTLLERVTGMPEGRFGQTETFKVTELLSESRKVVARMAMGKHKGAKVKRNTK
jgi:hypothetical protein